MHILCVARSEHVSCVSFNSIYKNLAGVPVNKSSYCGREFGGEVIGLLKDGHNGTCGPDNGPQCCDCFAIFPAQSLTQCGWYIEGGCFGKKVYKHDHSKETTKVILKHPVIYCLMLWISMDLLTFFTYSSQSHHLSRWCRQRFMRPLKPPR